MSQIQTARYEQFIRRLLRLVGRNVLVDVQADISPVLQLEDPSDPALLFWKGHKICIGRAAGTSIAAEFPQITIFNPASSEIVVSVFRCLMTSANAGAFVHGGLITAPAPPDAGLHRITDTRDDGFLAGTSGKTEIGFNSVTGFGDRILNVKIDASGYREVPLNVVLRPGSGWRMGRDAALTDLDVTYLYLERGTESTEL